MAWQRVRIPLPKKFDAKTREKIGDDIVQFIRDRCAEGQGVRPHGTHFRTYDFPPYSPAYAAAKGQRRVDLELSGEMLEALTVLSHSEEAITVGFQNGTEMNDRAEGNQTGSYGRDPNPSKARRFLGLTKAELAAILAPYKEGA